MDLGWQPFVKNWLQKLPRGMPDLGRRHLQLLFNHSVQRGLDFVKRYSKYQTVPAPSMSLVACLCNILTAFLDFMAKHGGFGQPGEAEANTRLGSAIEIPKSKFDLSLVI